MTNGNLQLYYATRDGQGRRIATRIADRLGAQGFHVMPQDLGIVMPQPQTLSRASLLVVIAAVRYGRHLPEAERLLTAYGALAPRPPLVLASVNLTARKPGKDTPEGNAYLRKLIARHALQPVASAAIAGRLDYPRYTWWERQIIRMIMLMTGGPTDLGATVEFTSWDAVDALAERIAALQRAGVQQP
jgi:menaquinone-dependent protoporphyrinogen oxidase